MTNLQTNRLDEPVEIQDYNPAAHDTRKHDAHSFGGAMTDLRLDFQGSLQSSSSEIVEVLHFHDSRSIGHVKSVRKNIARRIELVTPVLNLVEGKIDPALGKEIIGKETPHGDFLQAVGRAYEDVVNIDAHIEDSVSTMASQTGRRSNWTTGLLTTVGSITCSTSLWE